MSADRSYDAALRSLGSLISGKKRSDGSSWEHAYTLMQAYLQVAQLLLNAAHTNCGFLRWTLCVDFSDL